ncbi:hypothetical protein Tco_1150067 [Tanacetum coccineum]
MGNGDQTSVWFDHWAEIGVLSDFVSYRDLYDARLKANLTVSEFVKGNNGQLPNEWSSKFPMIYQLPAITSNQDHIDILMWKRRDGLGDFSVRQTYYDRQNTNEVVTWSKLVWFSQNISKHAFILWLAI